MKTIRVTGKGNLKVHPDMIRIRITLVGRDTDYAETLQDSADSAETIKDLLVPFGFERTDLKTLSFNVEPACLTLPDIQDLIAVVYKDPRHPCLKKPVFS